MKRIFHIKSGQEAEAGNAVLLFELSQYHICLALADGNSKQLTQLSYYELKNGLAPDTLQDVISAEALATESYKRTIISSACKEVVLVPAHHFSEESSRRFYTTMYGNSAFTLLFDEMEEQSLVLTYTVPPTIMDVLKSSQAVETVHSFVCQLRALNGYAVEDQLLVHFTSKEIRVIAKKEGQLKQAQIFYYTTPLDVVYYLLSICQQYGLSQRHTDVILSGLVSEDSAMYKELHQYFSTVHFWETSKSVLQNEYPAHFFSSMYNLAACVL